MSVAFTAVVRRSRSLLVLLVAPLSSSCFNPAQDAPLTTTATPDPTGGSTGDTVGEGTAGSDAGDTTAGTTSTDPADASAEGAATCGNRIVEGEEECDDGPANGDTAACKADCTLPFCGDGFVFEGTEECDDADDDDADECPGTCLNATCGDGFVWEGEEECDAAGPSEACDEDCTPVACGDGVTNVPAGEECDDGDDDDADECPSTCLNATCGDGFVQAQAEECDTDDLGGGSCMDFGLAGELACSPQCSLDPSTCVQPCPDGGAFVGGMCWYLSTGCDTATVTCSSHGLGGIDDYVNVVWDLPTMQALASHYGWAVGGDINCCVEFGWVENGAIYTHNFGPQFYNWSGCYDVFPTVKACSPP